MKISLLVKWNGTYIATCVMYFVSASSFQFGFYASSYTYASWISNKDKLGEDENYVYHSKYTAIMAEN